MEIPMSVESPSHVVFISASRLDWPGPAGRSSSLAHSGMVCRDQQSGDRIAFP